MKNKLSALFLMISFFIFLTVFPAMASPTVSLSLLDSDIHVGETFGVEVWVDGDDIGEDLLAFAFDVSLDEGSFFEYNDYLVGPGFDDDAAFFGGNIAAGSAFPGVSGNDLLLATLSFTALTVGNDILNTSGLLIDGLGLYYDNTDSDFDINASIGINVSSAPVPEPATMLLFGIGMVGLLGSRIRRKKK